MSILVECNIKEVVYGGGNAGLMGAVYRYAQQHSMHIVGHNLERWSLPEMENEIVYSSLIERQQGLITSSDMYIILPGGIGTLYELSQVLCHNDVERIGKPVILYNTMQVFDRWIELINEFIEKGLISPDHLCLYVVTNPDELRVVLQTIQSTKMKI